MNKLILCGLIVLLGTTSCRHKPKEVAPIARAEAAQNASEAEFAVQIRDYARAEQTLVKAVELDPTVPRYWKELGSARKHLGDVDGARKAYEKAFDTLRDEHNANPASAGPVLGEVEACVLLGKKDQAREILQKAAHDYPNDEQVKAIIANNVLDKIIADPAIQSSAL